MQKLSVFALLVLCLACSPALSATNPGGPGIMSTIVSAITNGLIQAKAQGVLNFKSPQPSGADCELCTIFVGNAMRYAHLHSVNIDDFLMTGFCVMFPNEVKPICDGLMKSYGPGIIHSMIQNPNPDQVCRDLNLCSKTECSLYRPEQVPSVTVSKDWAKYTTGDYQMPGATSSSSTTFDSAFNSNDAFIAHMFTGKFNGDDFAKLLNWITVLQKKGGKNPKDWLKYLTEQFTSNHLPPIDIDGDSFSSATAELRGSNWRGKDCNDNDANIYPGRKTDPYPGKFSDYNCNGISGKDPATGQSYKESLCANTKQYGVAVFGDSAGAHAEVPTAWVDGTQWSTETFKNLISTIMMEADLPHMSGFTGFADVGYTGPVNSVYKQLYQRNKCNFRDYQNVAVNGARSGNTLKNSMKVSRIQVQDHPLLMFLELVGNDVCSAHPTFDTMTTPENFRTSIIELLDNLDKVVPPGSHLVALGVVNGSMIYEGVKNRTHPSGISYTQLYDFQNCIGTTFCWGWLNSNETVRNLTTERAFQLNQVYRDIVTTYKAKNFDFVYYDFPVVEVWAQFVQEGNDPGELLMAVDGFHPSQKFHARLGDWLWKTLMTEHPDWLGEVNPNNDRITQLFGNQGGYY
jgi:acyloxyacyl hydrolase